MKQDIFRAKLKVDKDLRDVFESDAENIYEYVCELKDEIKELRAGLQKLEAAYEVYNALHKRGLDSLSEIAEATYKAALEEARDGNKDIAIKLLDDAASHGCIEAKRALAKAYIYGDYGCSRKPKVGLQLLYEAADEGDPVSCLLFTTIHDDYPRLVGPDVALSMCRKAAEMGYAPAEERLQKPFDRSEETKRLLARLKAGEKGVAFWLSTRDDLPPKEREQYFYDAVKEGDPMAELEMGATLLRKKDEKGAKEYLEKAVEHGNGPACFALIDLLREDKPPYWKGPELPNRDDKLNQEELRLVRRAAELGDNRGLVVLGRSYVRGYMIEKDYEAAKPLLEKALSQGEEDVAPQMLGEIYEHSEGAGTAEKSVEYYLRSANHGNLASMVALNRIYDHGLREVEIDRSKAAYYAYLSRGGRW